MNHRRAVGIAFLCLTVVCAAAPAYAQAQPLTRAEIDTLFDQELVRLWDNAVVEAARGLNATLNKNKRVIGTPEQTRQVFEAALKRLETDTSLIQLFTRAYVQNLVEERVESRVPSSVNAAATNPATAGLTERSGATSLAALAADLSSLVSADKSAISINLNALAFISLKDPELFSALKNYQDHDFARRFSGTVVFGAKIPESEITGLSNLPDFDKLLDAFSWDVKVRVWGDKDPRSRRWWQLTVGRGGLVMQRAAVLLSYVGMQREGEPDEKLLLQETVALQPLVTTDVGQSVAQIKQRIARSPQLSVKAAGTHLTKETGRNKYSFLALFDVGLGPSDVTANAQYAVTDDVRLGPTNVFETKIWTLSGDVVSHLAPGAVVRGRTIDWSVGASAAIFQDTRSLPVPVSNTWKLFTRVEIPVRGGGKIPVSVIYSNDPNALSKEKHVSGLIGVSYDFSAIRELFAVK